MSLACMYRLWRRSPLLGVLLASSVVAKSDMPAARHPDEAPFLAANAVAMSKMMDGMAVRPTGDADADFAAMMIPHHQGAIEMAEAELRWGRNEQLRRIAQEIIVDQQGEIAAMRLALGQKLPPSTAAPTGGETLALPAPGRDASARSVTTPMENAR